MLAVFYRCFVPSQSGIDRVRSEIRLMENVKVVLSHASWFRRAVLRLVDF